MLPLLSCVAPNAASVKRDVQGSLEPAIGTGDFNITRYTRRDHAKQADFGKFLATSGGLMTDYTCEVDLATTCKTGVVPEAAAVHTGLLLAPGIHAIMYGSSHMKEIGMALVDAHRMAGVVAKHGDLAQMLFKGMDPDLSDCDSPGDDAAAKSAQLDPSLMMDWASVEKEDADTGYKCNQVSYTSTTCRKHVSLDFQRFTFSTGAALTLVTNYGRLQRKAGQARLETMLPLLKMEGFRNVALVQAPHIDEYFDGHCKKHQDPSFQPQQLPNTFECVIDDKEAYAQNPVYNKLHAKMSTEEGTEYVKCVAERTFFKAFTSPAQMTWLETVLLVPWMYQPGVKYAGIYELGRVAREFMCSQDDIGSDEGKGRDDYKVENVPGSHLCMVVCQEGTDQCHSGAVVPLVADMLKTLGIAAAPAGAAPAGAAPADAATPADAAPAGAASLS